MTLFDAMPCIWLLLFLILALFSLFGFSCAKYMIPGAMLSFDLALLALSISLQCAVFAAMAPIIYLAAFANSKKRRTVYAVLLSGKRLLYKGRVYPVRPRDPLFICRRGEVFEIKELKCRDKCAFRI